LSLKNLLQQVDKILPPVPENVRFVNQDSEKYGEAVDWANKQPNSILLPALLGKDAPLWTNRVETAATFIGRRLYVWLRSEGFHHDVVEAVLAERGDDPYSAYRAVAQLAAWVERDDWMDLLNAYGRCIRIVRDQKERYEFQPGIDPEQATVELWNAYQTARAQVKPDSQVDRLLTALYPMIPAINRFFDEVLVMHEDQVLRENRLALLQDIWGLSQGIVDMTRLEGF
jgi:glycyl-tRNA synthetase beta subunit